MINKYGQQPGPSLLMEEGGDYEGLPYDCDERRDLMAAGGDLFRPVETASTALDAPLQPDTSEYDRHNA